MHNESWQDLFENQGERQNKHQKPKLQREGKDIEVMVQLKSGEVLQ